MRRLFMNFPRPSRKINQEEKSTEKPVEKHSPKIDTSKLRPSDVFVLDPQPDITAYEMALIMKRLYEPAIHFKSFLDLPEELQRHFRRTRS